MTPARVERVEGRLEEVRVVPVDVRPRAGRRLREVGPAVAAAAAAGDLDDDRELLAGRAREARRHRADRVDPPRRRRERRDAVVRGAEARAKAGRDLRRGSGRWRGRRRGRGLRRLGRLDRPGAGQADGEDQRDDGADDHERAQTMGSWAMHRDPPVDAVGSSASSPIVVVVRPVRAVGGIKLALQDLVRPSDSDTSPGMIRCPPNLE